MKKEKLIWRTEKRKINDLIPYEANPRQMTEKQVEDLKKSLEKFNLVEIPAIDTDNKIVAGHQRLKILQILERGEEEIDVRVPNRKLTLEEFREYNLRSNKNLGQWDYDVLANLDEEILLDVGFEKEDLDSIFGLDPDKEEFDIEKELEKLLKGKERRVKKGDVWQLGEHKLIIGDCVNKKVWEKLLGKERFDFMFTDPPYKLDYAKGIKLLKKKEGKKGFGHDRNRKYIGVEKRGGIADYDEWLSIANLFQNPQGANVMIFENWKNTPELWAAIKKYWKIKNMIIWWLPNRSQGWGMPYRFFNKYDIAPLASKGKEAQNEEYEKELDDYLKEKGQKLLDTYEVIIYGNQGKSYWDRKAKTKWAKASDHITHPAETSKSGGQNIIFGTKPIQILVPYIKILSPRGGGRYGSIRRLGLHHYCQ